MGNRSFPDDSGWPRNGLPLDDERSTGFHAYHDQVLSFDNPEIEAAWRRFVEGGRYKSVLHLSGVRRPHYGLTDPKEFFAEMTESYFGSNDFFPFNSEELRHEQPDVYALLAKIWGPVP